MILLEVSRFLFRKVIGKMANLIGYELYVARKSKGGPGSAYEDITPHATYAPWLLDKTFIATFKIIEDYTLVDRYKCYELWELVKESSKLDGAILEVGVWRGGSGCLIAKQAELSGIKSTVYLCDTFKGVVKTSEHDSTYRGGEHADTSKKIVEQVIDTLHLKNTKILTGIFPDDTHSLIEDTTFRFCHIDVDVYQSGKDIIEWVWTKLAVGGIVVFDDYGAKGCDGITKLVNEERRKKDRLVLYNLNGHGIIIKIA